MKKPIIGVLLGAVVYFMWGALSWMVLPWHNNAISKLPEEQLIMDTLKTVVTAPGFYCFPSNRTPEGLMDHHTWSDKFRKGPIGVMAYAPIGKEPMGSAMFLIGFIGCLVVSTLTMTLLCLARDRVINMVPRALFVMSIGLIIGASAHLSYWNWFNFPTSHTLVSAFDELMAFLLIGFAQAKFVLKD